ncbi:MAG: hypothetical protein JWP63_704 [Candidatus Solibacter sp.]|nr:hypothetical protein [Candidatus Solibacter sp.]
MPSAAVISNLARSLLSGDPALEHVYARAVRTFGRPWRWIRPLTERYVAAFAGPTRPRHRDVVRFLQADAGFHRARAIYRDRLSIAEWLGEPQRMQPAAAARHWNLPCIESAGALADWLEVNVDELDWFADLKNLGSQLRNPKLQHYRYTMLPKRSGGVRVIETPKERTKGHQRRILAGILDLVPVHPAVHGFVKGRSIVSFAAPHAGRPVLLRLDLQDFFPTFPAVRVQALFRTLGYPEQVADRLGGICTNATPRDLWNVRPMEISPKEWQESRTLYGRPHLPQGAPTSPSLANLMAYRLDCRLTGLARTAGATYTRYADDLAFSGGEDFARVVQRFASHAAAVAIEEGFNVNHHKTRIMRQGVRQHLAGLVVNEKVNLRRRDLELLEAILTNCVRHGPASQNRAGAPDFRAHLEGRVAFVAMINPAKALRLSALLESIVW